MSGSDADARLCRSCGATLVEGNAFCGVCGAKETFTDQSLSDHLIGQVVDRKFRLEACIATGGMGAVYRAEHVGIGKQVAIKFLRADLRGQPQLVHRLRREAKAVSKLTDVHSISVFDFGVWQGLAYLVMEYLQGEDLAEVLNREKHFDARRALHIAKSICSSLAEAHGVGVVHRDLKPENVFLTYSTSGEENVKVLDFGLAKILDENEAGEERFQTQDGALLGTPYYMAPEQVDGECIDARTDLYALGTLLYRMLTGVLPFTGKTPLEVFAAQRRQNLRPFSVSAPALRISDEVETLVRQLLSHDADERPPSAILVGERVRTLLIELGETPDSNISHRSEGGHPSGSRSDSGTPMDNTWSDDNDTQTHADSDQWSLDSHGEPLELVREAEGLGDYAEVRGRDTADLVYARKLRRGRVSKMLLATLVVVSTVVGGWWYVNTYSERPIGLEQEPNDSAREANVLRLGHPVTGFIGARLGQKNRSDQDVYLVDLNGKSGVLRASVSAVPNIDLVLEVFTDRGVEVAKANQRGIGESESIKIDEIKANRIQVRVRGLWEQGIAPKENSTDPYRLRVSLAKRDTLDVDADRKGLHPEPASPKTSPPP